MVKTATRRNFLQAAAAFAAVPARTIIGHLNEMGHAPGHARWTWQDGLAEKAKLEVAGHPADVPLWGTRLV